MTVADLIRRSLKEIGVLAAGEGPSATEQQDAIDDLNDMLDTWTTEKLFIYSIAEEVFPFVGGQQTYAMGPTGDFDTTRPSKVDRVFARINGGGPAQVDIPIQVLNTDQWAYISVKNTQSTFPLKVYPDYQFPLAKLNFWPIPTQADQVLIYSWKPLTALSDPTEDISLPPGFSEAIRYNLAIRLCPQYGKTASAELAGLANSAKMNLKIINSSVPLMRVDQALMPTQKAFNWLTGE